MATSTRTSSSRLGGPLLALTAVTVVALSASSDDGPVLCPFRRCTGGYCPGCGMTRSAGSLIRGNIVESWHHHPFVFLALAQVTAIGALWLAAGNQVRAKLSERRNVLCVFNTVVVAAIWVARLATGSIPLPFA